MVNNLLQKHNFSIYSTMKSMTIKTRLLSYKIHRATSRSRASPIRRLRLTSHSSWTKSKSSPQLLHLISIPIKHSSNHTSSSRQLAAMSMNSTSLRLISKWRRRSILLFNKRTSVVLLLSKLYSSKRIQLFNGLLR